MKFEAKQSGFPTLLATSKCDLVAFDSKELILPSIRETWSRISNVTIVENKEHRESFRVDYQVSVPGLPDVMITFRSIVLYFEPTHL